MFYVNDLFYKHKLTKMIILTYSFARSETSLLMVVAPTEDVLTTEKLKLMTHCQF